LKNIKKKLESLFKIFFYKTFILFHGSIKGKINAEEDSRIKIEIVEKESNIKYKIFRIKNARLYTDRIHDLAIILDNYIVEGPSYQLRPVNNVQVEKNIVFEKGTPRKKKILNGKVLSLLTGGAGNSNYWHWLFDVLPRFALCEKILNLDKLDFFLIPSNDRNFQKESLDLLNISKKKCLSSKFFRHINASELFVTNHPYVLTKDASHDIQNIPIWISEWLKSKYINDKLMNNSHFPKKIYIDRSDSLSNTRGLRQITNEHEIKNYLENNGFKSITLGKFHFHEQVKIFNNAEIIVGLHGAGFANLCFCKPNTKVVELRSDTAGKMIENLAISNKLIHKAINCVPINFKSNNQFGHINVSLNILQKIIKDLN